MLFNSLDLKLEMRRHNFCSTVKENEIKIAVDGDDEIKTLKDRENKLIEKLRNEFFAALNELWRAFSRNSSMEEILSESFTASRRGCRALRVIWVGALGGLSAN